MNAHAPCAEIGETPEYAAPAMRRSLSDIVAEYDDMAESITAAITAFHAAQAGRFQGANSP